MIKRALEKARELTYLEFLAQSIEYGSIVSSAALSALSDERKANVDRPFRRRLWLYRRGFVTHADELFHLDENNPEEYLSNFRRYYLPKRINRNASDVLDNKILFHKVLEGKHSENLPKCYGFIHNGNVRTNDAKTLPLTTWLEKHRADFVARRSVGAQGEGVDIVEFQDGNYYIEGSSCTDEDLGARFAEGDWILTEKLSQATYAQRIFPDSLNTIRVLTLIDPDTGEPFILKAVHRFGGSASAPVDNWSNGGACADINLETGRLREAAVFVNREELEFRSTHPDSGEQITGVKIPEWDELKRTIRELACELRVCPFIGWDVVVTAEHHVCVIEGNGSPGNEAIQVHGGLFADDRIRPLLREHK